MYQFLQDLVESDLVATQRPVFRDIMNECSTLREDLSELITASQARRLIIDTLVTQGGWQVLLDEHRSLMDQSAAHQDQRMNDTLYFLTLVTTAIIPMQVLTGLYGMNFVDSEGSPTMPELTWKYGIPSFIMILA